jgi:hypothetical protein
MTIRDIPRYRLINQKILQPASWDAGEIVSWLGGVQAQDYPGALWAIGLRMENSTESIIENAIAQRSIIRTWPLRGTLHFVPSEDAHWMLNLLTPKIISGHSGRLKRMGITEKIIIKSKKLFIQKLQGGKFLTRNDMYLTLESAKISTASQRGIHILWRLALEGIICFGPRMGKQPTFVLIDEWIPKSRSLHRSEGLAELARRYFISHGPATLKDFSWWSGLSLTDAREGLEMVRFYLQNEKVGEDTYWFRQDMPNINTLKTSVHMLPGFDEFLVAYKNRTASYDPAYHRQLISVNGILNPSISINGFIEGTWKRSIEKDKVLIETRFFNHMNNSQNSAILAAAKRYAKFIGKSLEK